MRQMITQAGLDLSRLVNAKTRGGKITAQCPACAATGADKQGDHLVVFDDGYGKWGCVAFAGDKEHRRQIAVLIGSNKSTASYRPLPVMRTTPVEPRKLHLPPLRFPTAAELAQIANGRGLPVFAGLECAARSGMLFCAEMKDAGETVRVWILTDSSRRCAQARRLDGKTWQGIDAKAKTLFGSTAAWPIGAAEIGSRPFVALCEGGPDTLAAWTVAWWHGHSADIAPVCMAGSHAIHGDALPLFSGKCVWTFPHRDEAGKRAQTNWAEQLIKAGALWVKPFDVTPHKDLNDWLTAAAAEIGGDSE